MSHGFQLKVSEDGGAAYLRLPTYPDRPDKNWQMSKTIQLIEVLGPYEGPEVLLDFGPNGELAGIEILLDEDDNETG